MDPEQQKAQRSEDHDEPRQSKEKMEHSVEIVQALLDGETFLEEWAVRSENLSHTSRPSHALLYVCPIGLRGKSRCQSDWYINRNVALRMQFHGRVRIFGHRLHLETTDFLQCRPSHDGARSAEERRVPEVVAGL